MFELTKVIRFTLLAILMAAGSLPGIAGEGAVMDKNTGKPIGGAHVVATWHGVIRTFVQPHSTCYHLEATTSDVNGKFHISEFSGNWNMFLMDRYRGISVQVAGYRISPDSDLANLRVVMERRTGSNSEQFKAIKDQLSPLGCTNDEAQLLPYLKARHQELARLAATLEEKLEVYRVLYSIESIELGDAEARRRLGARETALRSQQDSK